MEVKYMVYNQKTGEYIAVVIGFDFDREYIGIIK